MLKSFTPSDLAATSTLLVKIEQVKLDALEHIMHILLGMILHSGVQRVDTPPTIIPTIKEWIAPS